MRKMVLANHNNEYIVISNYNGTRARKNPCKIDIHSSTNNLYINVCRLRMG